MDHQMEVPMGHQTRAMTNCVFWHAIDPPRALGNLAKGSQFTKSFFLQQML